VEHCLATAGLSSPSSMADDREPTECEVTVQPTESNEHTNGEVTGESQIEELAVPAEGGGKRCALTRLVTV
jgi:hypothetical protein